MANNKTLEYEGLLLNHIFRNANLPNIGDATGLLAGVEGDLYISLHTATLDSSSDQSTSEATYTGYARVQVPRDSTNWEDASVSGPVQGSTANKLALAFLACTALSDTITDFGIGTDAGLAAGHLLYWGTLTAPLAVSAGITPQFAIGDLDVTEL